MKASDCTFSLIGDTQEEDRRSIADIVSARMQVSGRKLLHSKHICYIIIDYIFLECLPTAITEISISTSSQFTWCKSNGRNSTSLSWSKKLNHWKLCSARTSTANSRTTNSRCWLHRSSRKLKWCDYG